jgi:hypothetical protein
MGMTPGDRPARPHWQSAVLARMLWASVPLSVVPITWIDHLLRQAGRPELIILGASSIPYVLSAVSAATIGAVLANRRPHHPVGWLLLALGLSVVVDGVANGYVAYGAVARPGSLPAARQVAVYADNATLVGRVCISFVLLLTPTGSLPSPRWRWWARVMAVVPAALLGSRALLPRPFYPPFQSVSSPFAVHVLVGPLTVVWVASAAVGYLGLVVAIASLVVRSRRARGTERQQLRWVALGAWLSVPALVMVLVGVVLGSDAITNWAGGVLLALLPLATGAAILRYRLYDLDRIISRTVAYGLLSVLLAGGYAAVVLGLSRLFPQDSSLVVAAATLAVAAAFQPARRRIQRLVDRRFNRRRYDAVQTIAAYSARLRDQVDLGTLTGELLAVVDQTMQPTQASLWLRPQAAATATDGTAAHNDSAGNERDSVARPAPAGRLLSGAPPKE